MNTLPLSSSAAHEASFGRRVAVHLSAGSAALPRNLTERLRVARQQALEQRKLLPQPRTAPSVMVLGSGSVTLGLSARWWTRIGSVVPLIALAAGLITISLLQDEDLADELAEIDSALLIGDLPPAAYTDPGFAQFLKVESSPVR